MKPIFFLIVCGISFLWCSLATAADPWRQDTKLLPQYCKDRAKGVNSAEFAKWRGTLGEVAIHTHHYCSGIYAEQKARSTIDKQKKKRWLGSVTGEMAYVARHCSEKCVFYSELHTRWGWALVAGGRPSEAFGHYQLAIKANPKYATAYARLSDLYLKANQPDKARKVLEQGLKAKPGSRMLERRLREIES